MSDEPQSSKEKEIEPRQAESADGEAERKGDADRRQTVSARVGPSGEPVRDVSASERQRINRRELLKLVPVVALGAFAIPMLQQPLLNEGLAFSDWASERLFRRHRLAQTFSNSQVAPFDRFPYNYY